MKVICSGCCARLSGDPADKDVSHGLCSRECWAFYAALKEAKGELLPVDQLVARWAVRLPSECDPSESYDVSLQVDYRETTDRYGDLIDAPAGTFSWACECGAFTFGRETRNAPSCKHVVEAQRLQRLWLAIPVNLRKRAG